MVISTVAADEEWLAKHGKTNVEIPPGKVLQLFPHDKVEEALRRTLPGFYTPCRSCFGTGTQVCAFDDDAMNLMRHRCSRHMDEIISRRELLSTPRIA